MPSIGARALSGLDICAILLRRILRNGNIVWRVSWPLPVWKRLLIFGFPPDFAESAEAVNWLIDRAGDGVAAAADMPAPRMISDNAGDRRVAAQETVRDDVEAVAGVDGRTDADAVTPLLTGFR